MSEQKSAQVIENKVFFNKTTKKTGNLTQRHHKAHSFLLPKSNTQTRRTEKSFREQIKKYKQKVYENQDTSLFALKEMNSSELNMISEVCQNPEKYKQNLTHRNLQSQPNKKLNDTNKAVSPEKNLKETSSTLPRQKIIKNIIQQYRMINHPSSFNINNFQIIQKIGTGQFGKVFKVIQKQTNLILAMKVIQKSRIKQTGMLTQLISQLKIQSSLNHPNIIKLYGFFNDAKYFYVIMELGCDGQLFDLIKNGKTVSEETGSYIARNLLNALDYLHTKNILHRDIKPQNIVIIHGIVKLCDFGWSTVSNNELRSTICGTPLYLSPQLIGQNLYDEKVDIWALGILLYELVIGKIPFAISTQKQLYKIITDEVAFPSNTKVSRHFKQFIGKILQKNPNDRFGCKQLKRMSFIQKYKLFETCSQLCQY